RARIRYGRSPEAHLDNVPTLYFRPEDLYVEQAGRRVLLQQRLLDARRSVSEMLALGQLAAERKSADLPQVALADGLLTIWRQDWAAADAELVREQFQEALDAIASRRLPLAAYISTPHSHWVIDLLRRAAACRAAESPCPAGCVAGGCALDGLLDVHLFEKLAAGQRTAVFEVVGRDAERYGSQNRTHFFYIHVDREIARVEVPAWVAEDGSALDLVHAAIWDQARRGQGYPVALARAHEQAIVAAADRRAFEQLVTEALARAGVPASASEKQISKSLRAV
ncbi:MAG: hypothetical protein GEU73_12795, partial [Chloroflexi bacterium]|nr:hypothetical protein [Chloroflexota bacterium]